MPTPHQQLVSCLGQPLEPGNLGGLAGQHLGCRRAAGAAQAAHAAPLGANHHRLAHLWE